MRADRLSLALALALFSFALGRDALDRWVDAASPVLRRVAPKAVDAELQALVHRGAIDRVLPGVYCRSRAARDANDAMPEHAAELTEIVYEEVLAQAGSISAEHGVGILKRTELAEKRPLDVELMRAIKSALDPKGIMNPRMIFGG